MEKLVITPRYSDTKGPRELSSEIIQMLVENENFVVVGIGTSIPMVLSAINLSRNIANINLYQVSFDYIPIPLFGKQETIFIELGREKKAPSQIVTEFEQLDEGTKNYRTVWVSRGQDLARITDEILYKITINDNLRVMASGIAIVLTIKSVLQAIQPGISKNSLGVEAVVIESLKRRNDATKMVPSIQIYIVKESINPPAYLDEIKEEILKVD